MEGRAQGPFESSVVSGARKAQQQIQIHREPASTFGKAQPSLQVPHFHICKQGNSTWQRGLSQEWGEAGVPEVCQGPWPLLLRSSCWGCDRGAAGPPWRLLSTLQGVVSSWDLSAAGKAGRVQELWGQV